MPNRFVVALAALLPAAPALAQAEFLSETKWKFDDPRFGGLSALDVAEDGGSFLAVGDRGVLVQGVFQRDRGMISRIEVGAIGDLLLQKPKNETRTLSDSEGIARNADGSFLVSFESFHRVDMYSDPQAEPVSLPTPPAFAEFEINRGPEALAIDDSGAVIVIPETLARGAASYPVLRFENGSWVSPFRVLSTEGLLPVGADFGPDGALYLLERSFHGIFGFASRVRRFDPDSSGEVPGEIVLKTIPGQHDNLEGLAVWRDADGVTRLTMVSDDNFNFFQRSEIVEYRLTP